MLASPASGVSCAVTKYFIRRIDWNTAALYIAVKCKNGEEYHLSIEDDKGGSSRILACDVFEAVTNTTCWEFIDD